MLLPPQDSPEAFEKLEKSRVGVLVGTGMGGLQVLLAWSSSIVRA